MVVFFVCNAVFSVAKRLFPMHTHAKPILQYFVLRRPGNSFLYLYTFESIIFLSLLSKKKKKLFFEIIIIIIIVIKKLKFIPKKSSSGCCKVAQKADWSLLAIYFFNSFLIYLFIYNLLKFHF